MRRTLGRTYCEDGRRGAGGHQVVVQGGQQHVIAVLKPRHHALADAQLAGDFDLGHLRCLADHGEVHRIDPVHLLRVGVSSSDVGGKLRVGEQLVQTLVSADETQLAGRDRLIVSHSSSSSCAVSRFHWSISGSARAAAPS
jgi:hypothetical protein